MLFRVACKVCRDPLVPGPAQMKRTRALQRRGDGVDDSPWCMSESRYAPAVSMHVLFVPPICLVYTPEGFIHRLRLRDVCTMTVARHATQTLSI